MAADTGLIPYDLAGFWCEECGRAKANRLLLAGVETGCKACDAVTTAHRCTDKPDLDEIRDGQTWECDGCGDTWSPVTADEACPDCCGECGHVTSQRRWELVSEGDRLDTAPKFKVPAFFPMRNILSGRQRARSGVTGECFTTIGGLRVHIKPGCRCPRTGR